MQPWQEAGQKHKQRAKAPFQMMGKAANLLSYYVPTSLAVKGLGKLNPTLNKFFKLARNYGFSEEEALNNVREKHEEYEEKKAKSIFQEIVGDIDISTLPENIQNQLGFLQMAAEQMERQGVGRNDPPFKKLAQKIKKVLKGKGGIMMEEVGRNYGPEDFEGVDFTPAASQAPQSESQQMGPGQQALMRILQQIQATRGQQ